MWAVKAEGAWFQLGDSHIRMINTGVTETVVTVAIFISIMNRQQTISHIKSLLHALGQSPFTIFVIDQPINYQLDGMFVFFIKFRKFVESVNYAIPSNPGKAGLLILGWNVLKSAFFIYDNRRKND